eukprot:CAMPEP_0194406108 /NCGR_PEP_ID=MMETSP0176-20130528/4404_1 /TAXON_ID=216777 /ORGANISM="Proboscia alata, Strain PI-D3" /LENGTH=112 /DNA_ID=CAMNT_0039205211 /DNA_START=286 /DNA_END=624 /DNA_ORIENTATION=+
MATKKAGGSTSNGRDSAGRRLGVKLYHNMYAKSGCIIIRQRGTKYLPGENVGLGKDHTIYSTVFGWVKMEKKRVKKGGGGKMKMKTIIHVVPDDEENFVVGMQKIPSMMNAA